MMDNIKITGAANPREAANAMNVMITGAKTAKDAAHAAGFVFSERDAIVGRPAGLRHSRGYRVNVNGQASHWVECWHTPGGMLCCAVVYE